MVIFGLVRAGAEEGQTYRLMKDISFASVGENELKLDLYLPVEKPPGRLVVWIHGGGWSGGSKDWCNGIWLTDYGYAVASISYRLSGEAKFPAQIHDCKAAIRWLRANEDTFGYKAESIAVAGDSAGGHLALLLGTTAGHPDLEGSVGDFSQQSSAVQVIIDFFGASDFLLRSVTQPSRANAPGSVVYNLLGGGADQLPEVARLASPVYHVDADDPPLLIFHGDADQTVLIDQSSRIFMAYRETGLPVEYFVLKGAGHGGSLFYEGGKRDIIKAFLEKHLH